jgi:hypothetical protein
MTMGAIISQLIHAEDHLPPFISDFCCSFDNHIKVISTCKYVKQLPFANAL